MGSKHKKRRGHDLAVRAPEQRAQFFRDGKSPFLTSWRPALRETSEDVASAWTEAAARGIESLQNSGFMAGVADVNVSQIVGSGLTLAARPDVQALGWTESEGSTWSEIVERRWRSYAKTPRAVDAGSRYTHGQLQQIVIRSWMAYGEVAANLPFVQRPGTPLSKISLIPPSRISRESDGFSLTQGVYTDAWGAPTGYKVKTKTNLGWVDVTYPAFDADGRHRFLHIFDPMLASPRGISPFAPILKVLRQIDQYADATLTSALIQTIFAATIKTNLMGDAAFAGLRTEADQKDVVDLGGFASVKADWYEDAKIDLFQHGRVGHLMPGDELEFHAAKHPSQTYDSFMSWLIREIAACAGVTYESATGDYRGATYSSVRMATAEKWNIVLARRSNIAEPFCQVTYQNWLEEEIGTGRIPFPGGVNAYIENKAAAAAAIWTGPPRPQADDLKTARAHEVLFKLGVSTFQSVCGEYGQDWKEVQDQRARERDYALSLGLPDPHIFPETRVAPTGTEDKTDDPSYAGGDASAKASLTEQEGGEDDEEDEDVET